MQSWSSEVLFTDFHDTTVDSTLQLLGHSLSTHNIGKGSQYPIATTQTQATTKRRRSMGVEKDNQRSSSGSLGATIVEFATDSM